MENRNTRPSYDDYRNDPNLRRFIQDVIRDTHLFTNNIHASDGNYLNTTIDLLKGELSKIEDLKNVVINQHLTSIDIEKDIFWKMYLSEVVEDRKIALSLIKDKEILKLI